VNGDMVKDMEMEKSHLIMEEFMKVNLKMV
jgi:hypothetical protein